jgi:hypothetical protein
MLKFEHIDEDGAPEWDVVTVETAEDLYDLRDNHPEFHEGALAILSYKSAMPQGYISHDNPKMFGGLYVKPGDRIWKDAAGNFGYVP